MTQSTFSAVKLWNAKANNVSPVIGTDAYWEKLQQQAERIQEELNETFKAIAERDLTEALDGGVDLDVTVSGFNGLLGLDYQAGIDMVLDNNDLKVTTDFAEADESRIFYESKGLGAHIQTATVDGVIWYSVHRNSDNKIMKFLDHPKVDLSPIVAEYL